MDVNNQNKDNLKATGGTKLSPYLAESIFLTLNDLYDTTGIPAMTLRHHWGDDCLELEIKLPAHTPDGQELLDEHGNQIYYKFTRLIQVLDWLEFAELVAEALEMRNTGPGIVEA